MELYNSNKDFNMIYNGQLNLENLISNNNNFNINNNNINNNNKITITKIIKIITLIIKPNNKKIMKKMILHPQLQTTLP